MSDHYVKGLENLLKNSVTNKSFLGLYILLQSLFWHCKAVLALEYWVYDIGYKRKFKRIALSSLHSQ